MPATPTLVWAGDAPTTAPGIPVWLQVAGAVVTLVVGAGTVFGAVLTAKKTRLETKKLEKELDAREPQPYSLGEATAIEAGRPMAVRTQGYLTRFIILYLAYTFWSIFTGFLDTLVFGGVSGLSAIAQSQQAYDTLRYINLLYVIPQLVSVIVDASIFLAIGWPLIKDILHDLGLRPRVFWFRDVSSAFRSVNEESRTAFASTGEVPLEQSNPEDRSE